MESIFLWIIIFLASISTVITLAEAIGLLPDRISRWINRNRLSISMSILKELGVDIDKYKRKIIASNVPTFFDSSNLEKSLIKELKIISINEEIMVGSTEAASSPYYIDLMGASTNPKCAELFARFLSTHWRRLIENTTSVREPNFDFIVTPKLGSPILAYEFSKILNKPLALSVDKEKFTGNRYFFQQYFDTSITPEKGATALIVDDSTTGGRMALNTIDNLRKNGYDVKDFLIVFEPKLKNAREKILNEGVMLHSIVEMPFGK